MYLATDAEKKDSAAEEFEMFEVFYWVATSTILHEGGNEKLYKAI